MAEVLKSRGSPTSDGYFRWLFYDGNIYLNGEKLEEAYLIDKNYHFDPAKLKVLLISTRQNDGKVPRGNFLALGDNRRESFDSENYGFVPVEYIIGKVI